MVMARCQARVQWGGGVCAGRRSERGECVPGSRHVDTVLSSRSVWSSKYPIQYEGQSR